MESISPLDAFATLDMRTATIVSAEPLPQARKPAYKLTIDFGEPIGMKHSSAQLTSRCCCGTSREANCRGGEFPVQANRRLSERGARVGRAG